MSSNPPSTAPSSGISKAAAKKRAKKARAQAPTASESVADEVQEEEPAPIDPELYNFPPGSYPVDIQYDTTTYYDDGEVPPANGADPFSLPFPFDYTLPALGQQQYGNAFASIASSFNITHEDLFHTAAELYRRMGDPNFASDDQYWSSLSPHVKQFIRQAMPFAASNEQAQGANGSPRDMYDFAHKIVNAASQSMGMGHGVAANLLAGVNGRQFPQPGIGEELGFHHHPDAKDEEYDEEDDFDAEDQEYAAPNGDAPKKKNKKKKKKSGAAEPPIAALPPPALKQPPRQPVPPHPQTQPALNPPPPPVTPAPIHPPPSSRAAGKQPMSHVPSTAAPTRSARAAGKAPAGAAPPHNHNHHNHPAAAKPAAKGKAPANAPPAKIWTQASAEDRENIRQFWFALNEAERQDLVQIEKEAVLRKLKEQHRHSCGCAVCGRKKSSIEMEVDQLYDQYLDTLGTFTDEQRAVANGRHPPPPGAGPFPGSVEVDATGQITKYDHRAPDPKAIPPDDMIGNEESDEYDDEDEYDEDDDLEEDDVGSDEVENGDVLDETQPPPQPPARQNRKPPTKAVAPRPDGADDFLSFGTNLATIKGILTVADDLLKNDGAKFLEMVEQLASRRHVREEQNIRELEEMDEEDYDDKEEPISEAERAEEGNRMFQIFAARMFEQRVLQAYREKVAKQREEQLLRELEEEEDSKRAKEEKKAKEAQKKKDKKKMQKQKQDEEKAARDAAVAAEQQAAKAKIEEAERERQKKLDEERSRREAVKKAAQEEQLRIAADRRKRQQEEKEREEEAARKKREREEKARKEREAREKETKDRERREKEERMAKEKAEKDRLAKEKAEKTERELQAKEAREKAEKERLAKIEEDRIEKARLEEVVRKEREAMEQAKIIAAQQAQRERARAERAAVEKAAADKLAADKLAAEKARAIASTVATPIPVPVRATPRKAPTPQTTPPMNHPSPIKAGSTSRLPPVRQQKTPQPFFPQQMPNSTSYPSRVPQQSYMPANRPGFPPQSPVFSPPQIGGPSISPNPPIRAFQPEPTPPYDLQPRTAPIGMGFPPVKSMRMHSVDEGFAPPSAPIGAAQPRAISDDLLSQDFRSIGNPGPIGRPSSFLDAPRTSNSLRTTSPAAPEQVFGSAALGADDEIVQPVRRNLSNGWDAPIVAAPGASRWSANPSIWGTSSSSDNATTWGAPITTGPRQTSFGGIGTPFTAQVHGGFTGLFSPPGPQLQQPQHSQRQETRHPTTHTHQ